MEIKSFNLSFKDIDSTKSIVTGYFSSFDVVDRAKESVQKGAFKKTILETGPESKAFDKIQHCLNHKLADPVGILQVLKEDDFGLYFESKIGTHAKHYISKCEEGFIKQHSIGYHVIKSHKAGEVKYLSEINLVEGSGLTVKACNPNTPLVGIKSLFDLYQDEHFKELTRSLQFYQKEYKNSTEPDSFFIDTIIPELKALELEIQTIVQSVETKEAEPITSKAYNPTAIEISNTLKQAFKL